MQLSKYSLFLDNYPESEDHLIYNTRTQALLKVNSGLKDTLQNLPNLSLPPAEHRPHLEQLFRMGVIVRDAADDRERFEKFIEAKKYGINTAFFVASILTTYDCNFACTYCFEESTRTGRQRLERPTSLAAMEWLKKKLLRYKMKELVINYYGGEPLLNQTELEYIATNMKEWCAANGIGFKFMLQTNGALMTKELVERYKKIGLYKAKISLDGIQEAHDRNRPMRGSGKGTFETVIKNVVDAIDHIKISLSSVYSDGDPSPVLELMDYLDSIGILRRLDNFGWSPVHPSLGPKGHTEQINSPGCMSNYQPDTFLKSEMTLKEAIKKKGLAVKPGLNVTMCPVTSGDTNVTIDTQGAIYKCNAMLGHPELALGSIYDEKYNELQTQFLEADSWKKCGDDCPYAPICNTGCRLFAFFKEGDFQAKSCEREYMEKFVPKAMKLEYEKRMGMKKKAVEVVSA